MTSVTNIPLFSPQISFIFKFVLIVNLMLRLGKIIDICYLYMTCKICRFWLFYVNF